VVRALFPRSNLSVLSRGRFGGGHKPVLPGFPLLATHFATRTVRVDKVHMGMSNGAKSEGGMSVPSPLSHPIIPHLRSRSGMAFQVPVVTNTQEFCLRWIHIIRRVLRCQKQGHESESTSKSKKENTRKKHTGCKLQSGTCSGAISLSRRLFTTPGEF